MNHKPGDIWFKDGIGYTIAGGRVIAVKTTAGVSRVAIAEIGPDGKPQGECFTGAPDAALDWILKQQEQKP